MIISYQGLQSFKVQFGETVLAFDPISKKSEFKTGNFDICGARMDAGGRI